MTQSLTYERTFRVRHYECDAYGHVNHTNYLRYMQETAFDASAAAGYDQARYAAMQRHWLIRETKIEYLRPLRFGDALRVRTWVADFHQVRSRRAYEFMKGGAIGQSPHREDGELVAQAQTDWVFLDSITGRPATIPPELIAAFFPKGAPEPGPRSPFPSPPPPPPGAFKLRRRVEWRDIDPAQHVNNATYMAYMEDAGVQAALAHGWPMARMMAEGFAIVARQYHIEYLRPALLGDEVELATWVSDVKRATAVRHYTITHVTDETLLARASANWVWVDVLSGKPIRIPSDFVADFAPNIV